MQYIYLLGLSLRQIARTLETVGVSRSREAVRRWIHRLAEIARRLVLSSLEPPVSIKLVLFFASEHLMMP